MKIVYILFQTDQHQTKSSRVIFGAFSSYEKARAIADRKNLITQESQIHIEEMVINRFSEA